MKIDQIVMTVEKAKELLATVEPRFQRSFRKKKAEEYARDLKNGKWNEQGEVFRVSKGGFLIDGQHRCAAVIIANMPMPYPVILVTDVDEGVIHTIDRGMPRKLRDVFHLYGYCGKANRAGELALLRAALDGKAKPTDTELIMSVNMHPSYLWVEKVVPHIRYLSAAPVKLAMAELWERDPKKGDEAVQKLIVGDDMKKGHPILTLRNYLLSGDHSARKNRRDVYLKSVSALYAFLNNQPKTKLYGIEWPK